MRRSPLVVVYLTVFIDLLGFGIILPILPFYAEKFGADGFWVGAVLTAYSAAQFVSAFFLGRLSDRIGRRPVLLVSLVGSAVSLTVMGLANSLAILLLSRVLAGAFGGSIPTAQAYVADVTRPEDRTKYMGLLGASIGMGFVFGPAIGAGLSGFGFSTACYAAAALAAANFIFGFVSLPESRPEGQQMTRQSRDFSPSTVLADLSHPTIGPVLLSMFLSTFAFVGMEATFALLGQSHFGLGAASMGIIFTFVGVVIAIVQGGIIGRLNAKLGERILAVVGTLIMGLGLLTVPLAPTLAVCLVPLGALAVGQGLLSPTLPSLLSLASAADEQGGALGIGQSVSSAARAVGPLVAGWLFDQGEALPYVFGTLLLVVTVLSIARLRLPARATTAEVPSA